MKKELSKDVKYELQDFDLFKALEAIDKKDYDWFKTLTDDQKRKFIPFMLLQWNSVVKGSDISKYYLMSTEFYANKHMFNENVITHPELQWLMLCASSPGVGKQFHQWIPQLSEKFSSLKEKIKLKEIKDYLNKVFKTAESEIIDQYATEFTSNQNLKYKLGEFYPEMKLDDISILSEIVSEKEIKEYEEQSGIQ